MAISSSSGLETQPELEDFAAYAQHERWTREQLLAYQAKALHACRDYAYAHSPFYQRFHQGLMDRPLHELPVLTKAMLMEHFDELVTDRDVRLQDAQDYLTQGDPSKPYLDRYRVMATSGSTGNPGIFLYSRDEGFVVGSSFIRSSYWSGVTPDTRVGLVSTSAPAHMSSQAPVSTDSKRGGRLQLSASEPLDVLVQKLNEWQPEALILYPSIGGALALEQLAGRLKIAPRSIICGSETMPSETRQRIEAAWQTRVFEGYGTTEGGIMASECSAHQGMHLFEDFSILEVVDQNNQPVAPGEQGDKVLLTVLFRRTQPLIRYEISDLARLSPIEQCACGRPFALLEAIQGRMAEILYFASPSGSEEKIYPYLFRTVFNPLPVSGWQVIQEQDGLHVFLAGAPDDLRDASVINAVCQALTQRGVIVPPIQVHRVTAITKNATGKTPMIISRVPRPAAA